MDVSVIIPTYNRGDTIHNILQSLEVQTFNKFDVIIVNDGSTDNTEAILEEAKVKYPFISKVIHTKNNGRATCRNIGALNTLSEIVIFYDDDVRPNPKSVETHYTFHKSLTKKPAILDGPALYDLTLADNDFKKWRSRRENNWYTESSDPVLKTKASLTGANKSMLLSTWKKLGGLKTGLNDAEDFEFAFRAMHQHGIQIYQWWDTWVYHDDFKNFREYLVRRNDAMKAGKNLYIEIPDIIKIYPERWIFSPTLMKKIIYFIFQLKIIIDFIDKSKFFTIMPEKVKYKFYETAVMSANINCIKP